MSSAEQATVFISQAAPHCAEALAEVLRPAGYTVRLYPEDDLWDVVIQEPPHLLMLQVADFTSRGYALCQSVRAHPTTAKLPILLIGTFADVASRRQVFAVGGADYLAVPVEASDLVARVAHHGVSAHQRLRQAERPSLLQASLQRLHNSLDLDTILQTAVQDVHQQVQSDRVLIYQFKRNGRGVITHEAVSDPMLSIVNQQVEDACFDREHAIAYWTGRVAQITDVDALGTPSQCYRAMLQRFQVKANLVVPIIHNLMGQSRYLWGLIILHQCHQPRQWQGDEVELLQELSAHLAIAIQQSRLFDQVRRQARQEMLLNHILDDIRASLDIEDILACTVKHLQAALDLRQCGITLLRHNLPHLPTPFGVSAPTPQAGATPLHITESLRRQLLLDSDVMISPYLETPLPFRSQSTQPITQGQTTFLTTAIRTDSQVQGVLWATPSPGQLALLPDKLETWEHSDLRLIEEVALQLSQALQQADLYQQLQTANDELQRLAHLDGLTQIANRREFDRYLTQEWQRLQREQNSLALVLADVDYFKGFNDTYGHLSGDDCLRSVGQLLTQTTKRPADLAARYGGEEFALILPNTDSAGAIALASEVQTYLKRLAIPNGASPLYGQVTLSFGITAIVPKPALSPEVLVRRADQALYAAKANGRNRYCLWTEAIELGQGQSTGNVPRGG